MHTYVHTHAVPRIPHRQRHTVWGKLRRPFGLSNQQTAPARGAAATAAATARSAEAAAGAAATAATAAAAATSSTRTPLPTVNR